MIYYVTNNSHGLPEVSEILPEKENETSYKVTPSILTGLKSVIHKDDEFLFTDRASAYQKCREVLGQNIVDLRKLLNQHIDHIRVIDQLEVEPEPTDMMI